MGYNEFKQLFESPAMSDDLFTDPSDRIEVDPADMAPTIIRAMTLSLAKRLAANNRKPWKADREAELQETISALVATANGRGLKTIRVIVTRKTGQKVSREIDVDKISKERTLQ
jgi:hypothetical protein